MARINRRQKKKLLQEAPVMSYIRKVISGTFYRLSDMRNDSCWETVKTVVNTMEALAKDSQISTALSYYATDSTLVNSKGQVIWASPVDKANDKAAEIVNDLLKRWEVNRYAQDHMIELAKIGNLYIPTSYYYREPATSRINVGVALDNNTLTDLDFDIFPMYKIEPDTILHLWDKGVPQGFLCRDDNSNSTRRYPESACIHFSLGGLLGKYSISGVFSDGTDAEYDVQFADPMLERAVQPTQTLSLLEDANVLSSMARTLRIICVEAGVEENEIEATLAMIKNTIEQQLSLNTASGDVQSFVNPQSPNNFVYVPKINGQDPISIIDLNFAESNAADSALLEYYQNKKLSVMGIPKEAMNFSSNEGLGGAGAVLSQRSSLYANALSRLESAYMNGWRRAINTYFSVRGMSGLVDKYDLHMLPIVTPQATVESDKRDAAIGQATSIVALLKELGVDNADSYRSAITEILSESLPTTGVESMSWDVNLDRGGDVNV